MLSQTDLNLTHRSQPAQGTIRMRPSETLFKMAQSTSAGILGQLSSVRSSNQHSYMPLFPVQLQAVLIHYVCMQTCIHTYTASTFPHTLLAECPWFANFRAGGQASVDSSVRKAAGGTESWPMSSERQTPQIGC